MTRLVAATEADFAWMAGEAGAASLSGLALPPGGVEAPEVLGWLRGLAETLRREHDRGVWLIAADGEVVGLCSYKAPPDAEGSVEIGYGVAASRRGRGHATRAVAALLVEAAADPKVRVVTARTSVANVASGRVVERNGLVQTGRSWSEDDGALIDWAWSASSASFAQRS